MFKRNKIKELKKELQELDEENDDLIEEVDFAWNSCDYHSRCSEALISEKTEILNEKYKIQNLLIQRDKEIERLKLENLNLKEELKIVNPEWQIEADSAWRINPVTGEREEYRAPYDFDNKMVRNLEFTNNGTTRKFRYFDKSEPDDRRRWKFYKDIPISLFNHLGDKKSKFKYPNSKNNLNSNIKNIDDLKNLLLKKGLIFKGKYSENVYKFIIENIGKSFKTGEFIKNCQYNNRESARQHINKFQEYEVIRKFGRGIYKVII